MSPKSIVIIQGHPDPHGNHFCHALAKAYRQGAESSGREIHVIEIATLDFPLLRNQHEFDQGPIPEVIGQAQELIQSAEHLVIIYPLWLGSMPALLKGFLEQVFRPGFAASKNENGKPWKKLLGGKTAHIVVTMGMPAVVYRWYYFAHSLKSLERNVLYFCGIETRRETLIGMVESVDDQQREQWLEKMEKMGRLGK